MSAEQAAALVGGQFPELASAPVRAFAEGWDNTVCLVADEWLFRFPRRTIALPGIRREIDVLPRIAPQLPLPIPVPVWFGTANDDFPWPFWGARLVPGVELAEADLPDERRVTPAAQLGAFLRVLHSPALRRAAGDDLPVDPMGRATPSTRGVAARQRLDRLATYGVWRPDAATESLLSSAESVGPPTAEPVLVHGDLHLRHVLLDPSGEAAGVIDWGDVCLADPAVDLSIAYAAFTGPARDALLAEYGGIDPERELRARVLALFLCAALAEYAVDENRSALLAESLAGLRRAVAR